MNQEGANTAKLRGIPVFIEHEARTVSDAVGPITGGEWHPANAAAVKLWACIEAARDIDEVLGGDAALTSRRLKVLITPLASLRVAVTNLGDFLRTSPDVKGMVSSNDRKEIERLLSDFKNSRVFTTPADLKLIRDKLSAHVDRKMKSWSAQDVLAALRPPQVGAALNLSLSVLLKLLSIDVYAWTASDCPDGFLRLMNVEPSLVTFVLQDGQPRSIVRVDIVRSPRYAVSDLCQSIAAKTVRMFDVVSLDGGI